MTSKQTSSLIGLLFIIPFAAYGIGNSLLSEAFTGNDISYFTTHKMQLYIGAILIFVNVLCVAGIGLLSFNILKVYSQKTAITYLCARLAEAVLLAAGLAFIMPYINNSNLFIDSGAHQQFKLISLMAFNSSFWAYQIAMLILGLASIGFCNLLYTRKLVPAWLAVWGIAGYCLLAIGTLCEFFGLPVSVEFSIIGGLFELVFSVWLIIKGFRTNAYVA